MTSDDEQKAIEEAFVESWDQVENIYKSQNAYIAQYVGAFPDLISGLRKRNYDRQFRAGTQLLNFILSRAEKNGLRAGQAHL